MPPMQADPRVRLHREVAQYFSTPANGELIILIIKGGMAGRYSIQGDDLLVIQLDETCTVEELQELYFAETRRRHIFEDGRDYLEKETILVAANYFNDGIVVLKAFEDFGESCRPPNMICPTISEGQRAALPLSQEEKDDLFFSKASHSDCMDRLQEKRSDDRFEAFKRKGAGYFQCHDCPTKVFRPNISIKAMASHLEDYEHQLLVEARLIRESAIPGATKHPRMLVFESAFQELLAQLFEEYSDDIVVPRWEMEYECESVCTHDHTTDVLRPRELNIRCLESPKSASGERKEWDLEGLEEHSYEPDDEEWRKSLKHLETKRHREYVDGRLERVAKLGRRIPRYCRRCVKPGERDGDDFAKL